MIWRFCLDHQITAILSAPTITAGANLPIKIGKDYFQTRNKHFQQRRHIIYSQFCENLHNKRCTKRILLLL